MADTLPTLHYAPMPASALAYLLRRQRVEAPGPLAPFHRLGAPAPLAPGTVQALSASGVLDPRDPTRVREGFGRALDVLLDPTVVLTLRFWTLTSRAETHLYLPGAVIGGGAVTLNRDDDGQFHIVAPLDSRDVVNLLEEHALDALAHADHLPFEAHLDLATAAAWLGAIDHARARVWDGTARPDDPAPAGDIVAFIRHWWGITGLDAGLTALPVLTETPSPPSDGALRAALRQLAAHGLLEVTPRGFAPVGVTRRLVYDGRLAPLGMQWQHTVRDADGLVVGHRIVLLRAGGLALCLDRSVPGHVLLRTVTLDTLVDELADRLLFPASSWMPEPIPQPDAPSAVEETCSSCGTPRKEGATFCVTCGTAFGPPPPRFCRQCGEALAPGTLFCTSCGHRTA